MEAGLYKYSGAGNDFLVLDGRREDVSKYREAALIQRLCSRSEGFCDSEGTIGADGLMILSSSPEYDFRMEFFNPDGSGGMMCGNGGRCIVAFADHLGIRGSEGGFLFEAPDGLHEAQILSRGASVCTVRLKMIDVTEFRPSLDGWFLNTGTRHFVRFVGDVDSLDILSLGPRYRHDPAFAPQGANANFVQRSGKDSIEVRTFEKGVEAETLACGTGITASALALELECDNGHKHEPRVVEVRARVDNLRVEFTPCLDASGSIIGFEQVYLTGPARLIR